MGAERSWMDALSTALSEALPSISQIRCHRDDRGRFQFAVEGRRIDVELCLVRGPRIAEVEGELAKAILRLGDHSSATPGQRMVVVALSKFGMRLERSVRAFMRKYAPNFGWALMDERGQAILVIPEFDLDWKVAGSSLPKSPSSSERQVRRLFSDLNCWMMKVLLLRGAPQNEWSGPRKMPSHPTELAEIARVSSAKAHIFARDMEVEGYLKKSERGLKLVRRRSLLESWLQVEKSMVSEAIHVRPLIPLGTPDSELTGEAALPHLAWSQVALGGARAAEKLGLLRTENHNPTLIHVRTSLKTAVRDWGLRACAPRDASAVLSRPFLTQSVFRGISKPPGGIPTVDVWQVALDAIPNAARGEEQATFIMDRLLGYPEEV